MHHRRAVQRSNEGGEPKAREWFYCIIMKDNLGFLYIKTECGAKGRLEVGNRFLALRIECAPAECGVGLCRKLPVEQNESSERLWYERRQTTSDILHG